MYIRAMETTGCQGAQDRAAKLKLAPLPVADSKTLEAIIANRYEVMAKYAACATQNAAANWRG
jgi:stearoyl-CoA desaturase (delta-9 desaturase)